MFVKPVVKKINKLQCVVRRFETHLVIFQVVYCCPMPALLYICCAFRLMKELEAAIRFRASLSVMSKFVAAFSLTLKGRDWLPPISFLSIRWRTLFRQENKICSSSRQNQFFVFGTSAWIYTRFRGSWREFWSKVGSFGLLYFSTTLSCFWFILP